ncbi:hypothetical protein KIN20_023561 [Parelaphostrongylus tenuis]|uniref:Uncharacterized protein n=1 Tax=Parelaphostrongylus tenuis TaxID=148309 RepID=A0AAD5N966_PARTN|nr:hypothetical protein KIN20_023561 [Parelaphostrongylus tenuis]
MRRLPTFVTSLLASIVEVLGCGVMPQGQAIARNFTVSGFKLPTAMVLSAAPGAAVQLPGGIATTSDGAKSFISRLVMQTASSKVSVCKFSCHDYKESA